ncbi:SDR family NAD(P)-dependent oxidoreductase [Novosphingobium pentaromativorans]|nr:SDR family NAD(P)-dependent oxidoreductase [Novosphingobium pentaromativorans]AIT82056.1 hypothetical protein JI59_21145 [Novosphingobium pentaromativorans US6-1]
MSSLEGKVAVVTGSASGLGKETARRLAQEGAQVILADIRAEDAAQVASEIQREFDRSCRAIELDCANQLSCQAVIDDVASREGRIDILCNVAGVLDGGQTASFEPAAWDRLVQINLSGNFYMTRAALPHLVRVSGSVVNIASTAGLTGHAYLAAYCATKHGIIGLTRALAAELAHQGVTVNAICPGQMETGMAMPASFMTQKLEPSLLARLQSLTGKVTEPRDVAGMILFLVGPAGQNVTGAVIAMDGGQTTS